MPDETIEVRIEDAQAIEAQKRINQGFNRIEAQARKTADTIESTGQTTVTTTEKGRNSLDRLIRSLERRLALEGKTGSARLMAERDLLIKQYGAESQRVQQATQLYNRLAAEQDRTAAAAAAQAKAQEQTGTSLAGMVQHAKSAVLQLGAMYLSFQGLKTIIKDVAVGSAVFAARTETMGIALEAAGKANDVSVRLLRQQEQRLKSLGIATQEARQSLLRMVTAQIDLNKATELGRLAQNAAIIGLMNSSEAFDQLIYGIQSAQVRVLRTIGINVDFEASYRRLAQQLGKTTAQLTDQEKVQARVNEVLRVAPRFAGLYEEAMGSVGKQMTSLKRHFDEAKNAVGNEFLPALQAVVTTLEYLLKLIQGHPEMGTALTLAATGGMAALGTRALLGGAAAKRVGAVGVGAAGTGYLISQLRQMARLPKELFFGAEMEPIEEAMKLMAQVIVRDLAQATREAAEAARLEIEGGATQIRQAAWEKYHGSLQTEEGIKKRIKIAEQEAETAAAAYDIAGHRRAMAKVAALEKEIERLKSLQKQYEELRKAIFEDIGLGKRRWLTTEKMTTADILMLPGAAPYTTEAQIAAGMGRVGIGQIGTAKERETGRLLALGDTMKGINAEWALADKRKLESLSRELRMHERLIQLQMGPGGELEAAERIYQKRLEYAEREFQIHKDRAKHEADLEEAQIDRITRIAEEERRRFDELKHSAEGIFDALLTRSRSIGQAILDMFKMIVLTPIKEAFSTMIAGMMMPLYGRRPFSLAGLFGAGAMGATATMGAARTAGELVQVWPGVFMPAEMLGPVGGPITGTGGYSGAGMAGAGGFGGWGAMVPAGAMLGGLGLTAAGLRRRSTAMTVGGGAALGYGLASQFGAAYGWTGAAGGVAGAGAGLALAGLQRGGWSGLGMTTAGGALVGLQFGGPVGAAIGAGVGAAAGLIRMLFKGAEDKAKEKIRALYGVEIRDKGILGQIIETAKQAFGGNLDVAIRSPGIRDLIELYAMSTGQNIPPQNAARPTSLIQVGGKLYQEPLYIGGTPYVAPSPLPTYGAPQVVQVNIGGETLAEIVFERGQVTRAVTKGMKASVARREITALALNPGLVTS